MADGKAISVWQGATVSSGRAIGRPAGQNNLVKSYPDDAEVNEIRLLDGVLALHDGIGDLHSAIQGSN